MKIGVNTRMLISKRMEGIARYSFETLKLIVRKHPEHHFFFFFDRQYNPDFIFGENVSGIVLYPPARHPILWYIWFEHSLRKALKRYHIDIFYSPDGYLSVNSEVKTLLVSHDIAYMHFPKHIPRFTRMYYQKNVPKFHHRADHIIAVSETTKKDLIHSFGLEEEKITVAYNAVNKEFHPIDQADRFEIRNQYANGKPFFVCVGAIHPRKNIAHVIRGYDLFCADSTQTTELVIVGRWAWKSKSIKEQIRMSPNKHRIHVYTGIDENIHKILAAAEALIYVSLFEGFGLPVLEAMYCETPVITSANSSMEEIAGEAAILVDPLNVEQLKNAMILIREKQTLNKELIERGKIRRQRFSWAKTANIIFEELENLYSQQ